MKSSRLNLAERFLLLALDDERGRIYATNSISAGYGLGAAILITIVLRREIQVDKQGLVKVVRFRSEEQVMQLTLNLIRQTPIKYPIDYWVSRIARNHLKNQQLVLNDLCNKGILAVKDTKVGSQFDLKQYPTRNPEPEKTLRKEINRFIQKGEAPRPSLFFLLILIHACGIEDEVFPVDQRQLALTKLEQLEGTEFSSSRLRPETTAMLESIHKTLSRIVS